MQTSLMTRAAVRVEPQLPGRPSTVEYEVTAGGVSLHIQLDLAEGGAVARWMPVALDGPYPGGAAYVEPPVLVLRADDRSNAREIPLASMRLIGLDGLASLPGQAMPRVPLTVRFGLRRGAYRAELRFTAGDAARRAARDCVADLGSVAAPSDLPPPRRAPLNEAAVVWVEPGEAPALRPAPAPAAAFAPQRVFAAQLAAGAQALLEHGYCPWQTTHLSPDEHPAPPGARHIGDLFHERGLGFYLESLARAARLTGEPAAARAASYAARTLEANVVDAPWGGRWWGVVGFRETDNCLHAGICCLGLHEAHLMTGAPEPLRAAAAVLESWPYDENESAPAEIVDSRGRDPRGTFVYNQRLHLAAAMALVGRRLGRADLVRKGDATIRRVILPAMREDGDWPYLRGGQPSPHYTILLLKLLALAAWETDWADDPAMRAALARGARHALDWWSWRQDDRDGGTVLWSDVYAGERRPQLALAKAAAMTAVLGFLAARVDPAFAAPLLGTVRGIYAERDAGWLVRMGAASWLHTSVLAPLLDLSLRGCEFGGDGQTLETLAIDPPAG